MDVLFPLFSIGIYVYFITKQLDALTLYCKKTQCFHYLQITLHYLTMFLDYLQIMDI
jgi:hypothetical protein